jgi:hypothetical protein
MRLIQLIFRLYPCTQLPISILQLQYQTISQLGWGGWVVLTCNLHGYIYIMASINIKCFQMYNWLICNMCISGFRAKFKAAKHQTWPSLLWDSGGGVRTHSYDCSPHTKYVNRIMSFCRHKQTHHRILPPPDTTNNPTTSCPQGRIGGAAALQRTLPLPRRLRRFLLYLSFLCLIT